MKHKIFLSITALTIIHSLTAQHSTVNGFVDSIHVNELKEIVVTGQYKPQSLKNSVYQIRIISKERMQQQGATKLQDVLNNELNLRFTQDLATGGSDMTMLGLGGQNVKILLDGVPMIGRQGTSNEININQIDINTIERIEIVEGPLSVVYGADALAGVINIITKKPAGKKLIITARLQEETVGNEYGWQQGIHNQHAGISYNYKNWQLGGGIGRNLFNGWRGDTTGRELRWHKKDQIVGNGFMGYQSDRFSIYYRFDGLDEIITNPSNRIGNEPATDQDYLTKRLMQQIQSAYTFNGKLLANAQLSYTNFSRQVYSTLNYPNGDVRVSTAPGAHSINRVNGLTLRATVSYKASSIISFQPGVDINSETGEGERIKAGTQRISDYAFFFTSEITPLKRISIRPGFRIIHNSAYQAPPVIPSINTKFVISKAIDLRLAYARGFRAPSLRELYFDFQDASHDIVGNPNLKAEKSNSFTASINWKVLQQKNFQLTSSLTGFFNDIENMISYVQDANNPRVTSYSNIDKYKTRGTTLTGNLIYKNLNASLGFSLIAYYNQYVNSNKSLPSFTNSAEINSSVNYSFKKIGLDLNAFYKFTGKRPFYQASFENNQQQIIEVATEGFHWIDITANKKIGRYLRLNTGLRNLANITTVNSTANGGIHSTDGARPIGYGRSVFVGLIVSWEK
ncbi:MAG: TonB-dependent receptor plug domain-containing protein [Chitinophagaceae bacterium]